VSSSFRFDDPDHFTAGTVGEPGRRVFYLQARQDGEVATLRLEKQQVAALSEYLGGILADLPDAEPVPLGTALIEPVVAEWVVRTLAVAYEEAEDRILLVAEELVEEPTDDPDDEDLQAGSLTPDEMSEPASDRFRLTRTQVAAFIVTAGELVTSGRPLCRLCGQPMDPDGHPCPRLN
jgi:uncharacterized repeat protein (TIGR03847 family)